MERGTILWALRPASNPRTIGPIETKIGRNTRIEA
jgi:hypothetical protein